MTYKELRDADSRLLGRYDPSRKILEIKSRGIKAVFDLTNIREDEPPANQTVRKPLRSSSR